MAEPNWRTLVGYRSFDDLMAGFRDEVATNTRLTNWNSGGLTRTVFELVAAGIERTYALAATVASQSFALTAKDAWLDQHLADVGLEREVARKVRGVVQITCSGATTLSPGHTVATAPGSNGVVHRFTVAAETTCGAGSNDVPVIAVVAGTAANVAAGTITVLENVPGGVTAVTNGADWITLEGTDDETNERALARYQAEWTDPAGETLEQYESWALAADPAVLLARAMQVRGPGSVDVMILGPEGAPSDELLAIVDAAIAEQKLLCRDVLVRGPELVEVEVEATLYLTPDSTEDLEDVEDRATERARAVFGASTSTDVRAIGIGRTVRRTGPLLDAIKGAASSADHVVWTSPSADVVVTGEQLATLASVSITVARLRVLEDGSWGP